MSRSPTSRAARRQQRVQSQAVLDLGLAAGAEGAEGGVDQELTAPVGTETERRGPPVPERAVRIQPRPFERGPSGPGGQCPQQDGLGVVDAGDPPGTDRLDAEGGVRTDPLLVDGRQELPHRPCGDGDQLVRVDLAPDAGVGQLGDRAGPRLGHDDAVDTAPPELGGSGPPLDQRRVLQAGMVQLVLEVGDQAVPAVELPEVHDLGPAAGRADRAPHAEAELIPLLAGHRAPVGRHVVHVLGPVGPDDVDELVDVHLRVHRHVAHAVQSDEFEGHSGRW